MKYDLLDGKNQEEITKYLIFHVVGREQNQPKFAQRPFCQTEAEVGNWLWVRFEAYL